MTLAGILAISLSWWAWNEFAPRLLDDKLEYIGEQDYGCVWFCDSRPGTTYFYATDLTPPELAAHLKSARATDPEFQIDRWQNRGQSFHIDFTSGNSSERFTLYFYTNPPEIDTLTHTTMQYVVSIGSSDYGAVLNSL